MQLHIPVVTDIDLIIPYERNAKLHDDAQVVELAEKIKKYGFTQPIVVDKDNVIIIGHCRRLAALHLGLKQVPVVKLEAISEDECAALRLFDNRIAEGLVDPELVRFELNTLKRHGVDLSLAGFKLPEIDLFLDHGKLISGLFDKPRALADFTQVKDTKEPKPKMYVDVRQGDVWSFGESATLTISEYADKEVLNALSKLLLYFGEKTGIDPREAQGDRLSDRTHSENLS